MLEIEEKLIKIHNAIDISPNKKKGKIYHYTSPEGLLGIISNKQIFASDMLYLNDSAEGRYALELLRDICQEDYPDNNILQQSVDFEIKNIMDGAPGKYYSYIISFSEGDDLLNMWNYYTKGNSVEGYNIGFDITKLAESIKLYTADVDKGKTTGVLKPIHGRINYDPNKQTEKIREILHEYVEAVSDEPDADEIFDSDIFRYLLVRKIYFLGLFYKSPKFKSEKEYRFVYNLPILEKDEDLQKMGIPYKEEYRTKNGILIPYQRCCFSTDSVVSVMCAPTNDFIHTAAGVKRLLSFEFKTIQSEIHKSEITLRY